MNYHTAIYGNTVMRRGICPKCQEWALISRGNYLCCGLKEIRNARVKKIMSVAQDKRKKMPFRLKKKLFLEQEGKCYYCENPFWALYVRNNKIRMLEIHGDHFVPYTYGYNNNPENFVLSCNICNLLKGCMIFETREDAKKYVTYHAERKGIKYVPVSPLPEGISAEEKQKILLGKLQK